MRRENNTESERDDDQTVSEAVEVVFQWQLISVAAFYHLSHYLVFVLTAAAREMPPRQEKIPIDAIFYPGRELGA